jgi:hypothetical protein
MQDVEPELRRLFLDNLNLLLLAKETWGSFNQVLQLIVRNIPFKYL